MENIVNRRILIEKSNRKTCVFYVFLPHSPGSGSWRQKYWWRFPLLMRHKHELKKNRKHSESIISTETHSLISKHNNTKTVQIIQTQFDSFTSSRCLWLVVCRRLQQWEHKHLSWKFVFTGAVMTFPNIPTGFCSSFLSILPVYCLKAENSFNIWLFGTQILLPDTLYYAILAIYP